MLKPYSICTNRSLPVLLLPLYSNTGEEDRTTTIWIREEERNGQKIISPFVSVSRAAEVGSRTKLLAAAEFLIMK